jgi:undecaprenyl-diphosphatase
MGWLERLHRWDAAVSGRLAQPAGESVTPDGVHRLAVLGAHLGDTWLWLILTGWAWRSAHQQKPADGGRQMRRVQRWATGMLLVGGLTLIIKHFVRRPRPGHGAYLYGPGPDVHSFPSGHAMRMGVLLVWAPTLWPGWGRWSWLLALWVGWSRVRLGIHYVGDVLAGAVMGLIIGALLRHFPNQ